MLATVRSCVIIGLEGRLVEVQVDLSDGPADFAITGLSNAAPKESREHVSSAIKNSGYLLPSNRITVNLSPTDLLKEDPVYDLPIAVGVLLASGQINPGEHLDRSLFLGELSREGGLYHTNGILPMVALASEKQACSVFVPAADAMEARLVRGVRIYPVETLTQLLAHLNGEQRIEPLGPDPHTLDPVSKDPSYAHDMAAVRGQDHVKRAFEVAASGQHHILMSGPPGSGKTFLARCMPSILPPLTSDESLEITKIYSASGMLSPQKPLILQRPFHALHHAISYAELVGDRHVPRPGQMSFAHRGVLFLEELPEFEQRVLEVLHQPLVDKVVSIYGAQGAITYPANFMLMASMKPCPCGYFDDPVKECTCSASAIARYRKRICDKVLNHIDIHVEVPRVDYEKLTEKRQVESSSTIRKRVLSARERQLARFKGTKLACNAEIGFEEVREFCQMDAAGEKLLKAATQLLCLSPRANYQALKLARTIADLAGSEIILANHFAEALQYRL